MTEVSILVACIVVPLLLFRLWRKGSRKTKHLQEPLEVSCASCGNVILSAGPGTHVSRKASLRCKCGRSQLIYPFITEGRGGSIVVRASVVGELYVRSGSVRVE